MLKVTKIEKEGVRNNFLEGVFCPVKKKKCLLSFCTTHTMHTDVIGMMLWVEYPKNMNWIL